MRHGSSVGPYQIVRQLGAGGMGVVWLAEDPRLNRKVALKTVRSADADTTEGRQRLMREARAAAALNHPNIATVHDVLDVGGKVMVVFEYVEGDTLAARLQRGPMKVPADEQVHLRAAVVHALAGRAELALDAIGRARAGGIAARAIASEEDFAKLRPSPRFAALAATTTEEKR